jgi:hypothetical protein
MAINIMFAKREKGQRNHANLMEWRMESQEKIKWLITRLPREEF